MVVVSHRPRTRERGHGASGSSWSTASHREPSPLPGLPGRGEDEPAFWASLTGASSFPGRRWDLKATTCSRQSRGPGCLAWLAPGVADCITTFEESRETGLSTRTQNAMPARVQGPHLGEVSQA